MLLTKEVEIGINNRNLTYYQSKGYNCKNGDSIIVSTDDLNENSKIMIECLCDYCTEVTISKNYQMYIKQNKKAIIQKDCCKKCRPLKYKESNLKIHGVENTSSLESIKDKKVSISIEKYGVSNPVENEIVKNKIKTTNLEKYGFSTASQHPRIKAKALKNLINSKYRNGTAPFSRQQAYIHNVIGGEFNYPIDKLGWLDIAFPDESLYIEYDGSGHNLNVVLNNITQDEFDSVALKRYYYLKNRGWKMIRIISLNDQIPQDETLLAMITYAKDYLKSNHSWINFDIDNQKIICSKYEKDYDFGDLRKITENDIIKHALNE